MIFKLYNWKEAFLKESEFKFTFLNKSIKVWQLAVVNFVVYIFSKENLLQMFSKLFLRSFLRAQCYCWTVWQDSSNQTQ